LRPIPTLSLKPSQDLGDVAAVEKPKFPTVLRHLLRGIGADASTGTELLSYLAFQPGYVGRLISLGYDDTRARSDEIRAFFDEAP
jgi:NTE family protein